MYSSTSAESTFASICIFRTFVSSQLHQNHCQSQNNMWTEFNWKIIMRLEYDLELILRICVNRKSWRFFKKLLFISFCQDGKSLHVLFMEVIGTQNQLFAIAAKIWRWERIIYYVYRSCWHLWSKILSPPSFDRFEKNWFGAPIKIFSWLKSYFIASFDSFLTIFLKT